MTKKVPKANRKPPTRKKTGRKPGTFKPGQSGNPSGRPKIPAEIKTTCREHSAKAIAVLLECLDSTSAVVRLKAADSLLDRGFGKPTQSIDSNNRHEFAGRVNIYIPDNGRKPVGE